MTDRPDPAAVRARIEAATADHALWCSEDTDELMDTRVMIERAFDDRRVLAAGVLAVLELHQLKLYSARGWETQDEAEATDGWCAICGRFRGLRCPTVAALCTPFDPTNQES